MQPIFHIIDRVMQPGDSMEIEAIDTQTVRLIVHIAETRQRLTATAVLPPGTFVQIDANVIAGPFGIVPATGLMPPIDLSGPDRTVR